VGPLLLRSLRFVAVILFGAAECACREGTTHDVLATVLFVDGHATIDRGSRGKLSPLTADLQPGRGDSLQTPASSRAALCLLPNLLMQLDRGARMDITRLALTKDGNETGSNMRGRFAEIRLGNGRILVSHVWGEAFARFSVVTPHGEVATPSNALFIVEAEQQKTRVTCASGWVEFQPSGAAAGTRIPPGSFGQWPSAAPNLTQAEADPVAQDDLQQAVEVERILRNLAAQKRNVLPR
jgi:prepilin-type processing-associated H-X9-DG protein